MEGGPERARPANLDCVFPTFSPYPRANPSKGKTMLKYPALFEPDKDGGYTVTFRDIPEAITQGDTLEEARDMAVEALVTAMDFYFEDKRPVPDPSKAEANEELVSLPVSVAAKVELLNVLAKEKARPADLARSMKVKPQEVTRILDLHHATKIDTLAQAFGALGYVLDFRVKKAA